MLSPGGSGQHQACCSIAAQRLFRAGADEDDAHHAGFIVRTKGRRGQYIGSTHLTAVAPVCSRFLLENDSDAFNRWESAQTIARGLLEELYKNGGQGSDQALVAFASALNVAVSDSTLDPAFRSALVALPSVSELVDTLPECDITLLYACHLRLEKQVATTMEDTLRYVASWSMCSSFSFPLFFSPLPPPPAL